MSDTDPRDSNPNAAGPHGLRGDLGISSERTGPFGGDESESADQGVQGTGTRGTAAENTEGTMSTERQHPQEPAEGRRDVGESGADTAEGQSQSGTGGKKDTESSDEEDSEGAGASRTAADGPEMDDTQQRATQEWRDSHPPAQGAPSGEPHGESRTVDTEAEDDKASIDRTVGESNTAQVPAHEFDRTKNPGHSHG